MYATFTDRSLPVKEQLKSELLNSGDSYGAGPPKPTEEGECAPFTSEISGLRCEQSIAFSEVDIERRMHPKHAWSWLASAARGRKRFTASPHETCSKPAEPCSRLWQPRLIRLGASRVLPGEVDGGTSISNDGLKPLSNRLFSIPDAAPTLPSATPPGSIHGTQKALRPKQRLLFAKSWSTGDGNGAGYSMVEASSEKKEVITPVSNGAGVWASRGMLATSAMLYGLNFGCVELLQETVDISLVAALRFTVAVIPFLPFLVKTNLGVFRAGVEIGLSDAIGFWAQSKSLMTTTASKSAFICSLSVLIVPFMNAGFGTGEGGEAEAAKPTEAPGKKHQGVVFATLHGPWFPALLAVAGVAFLELAGVESRAANIGEIWALGQPLCFGVGFRLTERSSREYPGYTFGIVATRLLTVAILAISWCTLAGQIPPCFTSLYEIVLPSSGSLVIIVLLLCAGLLTTALPVFLETQGMQKISAAESTIIISTQPIWGTVFGVVLLGEMVGWNTGLGAVLIVLACTWSSVGLANHSQLLPSVAATGVAGISADGLVVKVDGFIEAVGADKHQGDRQRVGLV